MFLDNLSSNLLRICGEERITYAKASELCNCSSKHFSNIVNKCSQPSLNVFENICVGFNRTPNELLSITTSLSITIPNKEIAFRIPMLVTEINMLGDFPFPVCPRCKQTLKYECQAYCDHCGQCLSWNNFIRIRC